MHASHLPVPVLHLPAPAPVAQHWLLSVHESAVLPAGMHAWQVFPAQ